MLFRSTLPPACLIILRKIHLQGSIQATLTHRRELPNILEVLPIEIKIKLIINQLFSRLSRRIKSKKMNLKTSFLSRQSEIIPIRPWNFPWPETMPSTTIKWFKRHQRSFLIRFFSTWTILDQEKRTLTLIVSRTVPTKRAIKTVTKDRKEKSKPHGRPHLTSIKESLTIDNSTKQPPI